MATALAVFDRAKSEGIRISPDMYITLMYLCSGGDTWERQLSSAGEDEQQQEQAAAAGAAAEAAGGEAAESAAAAANGTTPAAAAGDQQEAAAAAGENGSAAAGEEGAVPAAAAPAVEQPPPEEVARRAAELFAEMEQSGGKLPMNEMCYTAMARLAALQGDADRAFALVQVCGRAAACAWGGRLAGAAAWCGSGLPAACSS